MYSQKEMEKLIWLQAQASDLAATWQAVQDYRNYYDGNHPIFLSNRQQEYLGDLLTKASHTVCFNVCRLVVDILRERLKVIGFESDDPALRLWVADLWNRAKLDLEQVTLHRRALRDGASYLIVGWDTERNEPTLTANRRYDGDAGLTYHLDGETNKPRAAVKYWAVSDPLNAKKFGQKRRTLFYSDRILRQKEDYRGEFGWLPIDVDEGPAVQYWTETLREGAPPLGLAAIEFLNPGKVSELEDIIGLQNAVNKALLDLLAAADLTGFQMYAVSYPGPASGAPTDDDDLTSDDIKIAPGRLLELFEGATMNAIRAGDLVQLIQTLQTIIGAIGKTTRTPQYYLWQSGNWGDDVPSGEALKQMESGLVARANERIVQFGDAWVQAMRMAARLHNAMGGTPTLNAEASLTPVWASAEVRNELLISQEAQNHATLGVPQEFLWRWKLGYTADQVTEMKRLAAQEQAAQLANLLMGMQQNGQQSFGGGGGNGAFGRPNSRLSDNGGAVAARSNGGGGAASVGGAPTGQTRRLFRRPGTAGK
jgi:hypothetical protein